MDEIKQHKVLFIDDDERTLRVAGHYLRQKGYEVVTSTQPFVAPILAKEKPHILVIDLNMPLISGDRLLKVLKANEFYAGIPVIFYSGEPEERLIQAVQQTAAAGYVRKELGLDALLGKIRKVLNE